MGFSIPVLSSCLSRTSADRGRRGQADFDAWKTRSSLKNARRDRHQGIALPTDPAKMLRGGSLLAKLAKAGTVQAEHGQHDGTAVSPGTLEVHLLGERFMAQAQSLMHVHSSAHSRKAQGSAILSTSLGTLR